MKICHLLKKEWIFLDRKPSDKKQLLEDFVLELKKTKAIKNDKEILEAILKREGLGSTGLEDGFAIPHALLESGDPSIIALYVIKDGIDFDAADHKLSYAIMLLLGSKNNPSHQLKILAHLCRMVKETDFVQQVREAKTQEDVFRILECDEESIS